MKVKNLLLAGLAAIAMTACNNENEFINDENPNLTGEQAKMRLLFSFDGNGGTRTATLGGDDAGTELEYGASKITVVLDYGNDEPLVYVKGLTLLKLNENSKEAVATTEAFEVAAGTSVKMYAFVNPKDLNFVGVKKASDLAALSVGPYATFTADAGLAYIDEDVAKPADVNDEKSGFLMSGETTITTIEVGKDNVAPIKVSRVAAKLDENTKTDLFKITSSGLTFTDSRTTAIGVKFIGHSYSNLVTDSYVLPVTSNFKDGFLQEYIPVRVPETNDDSYRWSDEEITYCLENSNFSSEKLTRVHYKAQVCFIAGETTEDATEDFYIRTVPVNGKAELRVYKNWTALKAVYQTLEDGKQRDDAYLKNYDIMRYAGGICYYEAPIETFETDGSRAVIVRNNWYKLSVSEVSKLGTPTPAPEPTENPTRLTVKAQIQPWKVQINDIKL